jgi:formylglycine-generating enzyme required for sulfatase activity
MIKYIALFIVACSPQNEPKNQLQTQELNSIPNVSINELPIEPTKCPKDMLHISGNYCPDLRHVCLKKVSGHKTRCAEFDKNYVCVGEQKQLNFCIDKYEYSMDNQSMPQNYMSWIDATQICNYHGKELCTDEQWTLSCEGNQKLPYPYGYVYNKNKCNVNKIAPIRNGKLIPKFDSKKSYAECLSPFGVQNMVGNLDELVTITNGNKPFRGALKGGWWSHLIRGSCRPMTTEHREFEAMAQVGFRCCKKI